MPKVALVTGARSGIGKAIALRLARAGWFVWAGVRELDDARDFATPTLRPLRLDVANEEQRRLAIERIQRESGGLDALINNAGVALGGMIEEIDEDELRYVFDVNVFGAWALTKAALPMLRARRRSTVVMVSSMAGRQAFPGLGAYASSKHALEGLSEALRHELRALDVNVVIIEPGAYRSDIWTKNRKLSRNAYRQGSPYSAIEGRIDARLKELVLRMARDPAEVGDLVLRLLEDPNPAFRWPVGGGARLRDFLSRVAPFWVVERVLDRMYGLPRRRR